MTQFTVEYQTKPGPGLAFYRGSIVVWADDESDAESRALDELGRDFPRSRILILGVQS